MWQRSQSWVTNWGRKHIKYCSLHLHFHLIFLWPVALCTESIFLTPFPIYYLEKAGREGRYWLTECSLCLYTKCTLHKNSNEIAVCFLLLCLYFKWKINNDCWIWLRCDSQYKSISSSGQHILFLIERAFLLCTKIILFLHCNQETYCNLFKC